MAVKVSICIPAFNSEKYIGTTIKSLLNQTYKDFEIIIVDDKSDDDTIKEVLKIDDQRIRLYKNKKNLGMAGNWNRCLELADGKYVKLICADDILYKNAIEEEVKCFENNQDINMVISDTNLINTDGKKVGKYSRYYKKGIVDGKKIAKVSLIVNIFFGAPCNVMLKKATINETGGFDDNFHYILDFDLWLRISYTGKVYVINKALNGFMLRGDSNTGEVLTTKKRDYVNEHKMLLNKHRKINGVNISNIEASFSLWFRKVRNFLYGIFLRLKVKK